MGLIENFIGNKIYDSLFLDVLLKMIREKVIELWTIGGSAIPAAIVLVLLMIIIALIPLIPIFAIVYFVYRIKPEWFTCLSH
jgi:hypothetical protein